MHGKDLLLSGALGVAGSLCHKRAGASNFSDLILDINVNHSDDYSLISVRLPYLIRNGQSYCMKLKTKHCLRFGLEVRHENLI